MKLLILWALIYTGEQPSVIQTFETHQACVQARYDFMQGYRSAEKKKRLQKFVCRQQFLQVSQTPSNRR